MAKEPDPKKRRPPAREADLAAALRANLRRRKQGAASDKAKKTRSPGDEAP